MRYDISYIKKKKESSSHVWGDKTVDVIQNVILFISLSSFLLTLPHLVVNSFYLFLFFFSFAYKSICFCPSSLLFTNPHHLRDHLSKCHTNWNHPLLVYICINKRINLYTSSGKFFKNIRRERGVWEILLTYKRADGLKILGRGLSILHMRACFVSCHSPDTFVTNCKHGKIFLFYISI